MHSWLLFDLGETGGGPGGGVVKTRVSKVGWRISVLSLLLEPVLTRNSVLTKIIISVCLTQKKVEFLQHGNSVLRWFSEGLNTELTRNVC